MTEGKFDHDVASGIAENARSNPPGPGTLDIQFWVHADILTVAAGLSTIAAMLTDEAGTARFSSVVVAYPHQLHELSKHNLTPFVSRFLNESLNVTPTDKMVGYVLGRIDLLPLQTVIAPFSELRVKDQGALIVVQAARLLETPLSPDEPLHPSFQKFLTLAVHETAARPIGIMIDAGGAAPSNLSEIDTIMNAPHVAVMTSQLLQHKKLNLADHSERWATMRKTDGLDAVLQDISKAEELPESVRELLKCDLLVDEEYFARARALFVNHSSKFRDLDLGNALLAARVATRIGESEFAKRVLSTKASELSTDMHFQLAYEVTDQISNAAHLEAVMADWRVAHPGSKSRILKEVYSAIQLHSYETAADLLSAPPIGDQDRSQMWRWFGNSIANVDLGDPAPFLSLIENDYPEAKAVLQDAAIRFLADRGRRLDALNIVAKIEGGDLTSARAIKAIDILESGVRDADQSISLTCIAEWLPRLFRTLANNPQHLSLRVAVFDLFEPELLGESGIPLLIQAVYERISALELSAISTPIYNSASPDEIEQAKALFEAGFNWLSEQPPFTMGTIVIPPSALPIRPSAACAILMRIIEKTGDIISDTSDIDYLHRLVTLGSVIAPEADDTNEDIGMLITGAGKMAQAGFRQEARDFAESLFLLGSNTDWRRRLAWLGYADTYARCGNRHEALTALAIALHASDETDWRQIWHEIYLSIRLFRDCGLIEAARDLIPKAREAMIGCGLEDRYESRLATIDLGLRFQVLAKKVVPLKSELESFLAECFATFDLVEEIGDETTPLSATIMQAISIAETHQISLSSDVELFSQRIFSKAPPRLAGLLEELRASKPDLNLLAASFKRTSTPRYASDTGLDFHITELLARRALSKAETLSTPETVLFASELLADRAFNCVTAVAGSSAAVMATPETPLHAAQTLAQPGCALITIASNYSNLVVARFRSSEPVLIQRIDNSDFEISAFNDWNNQYPAGYSNETDTGSFISSTASLCVPDLPDKAVIVADSKLQALPVNLIQTRDGSLAGLHHRLAAAPSLSWLAAMRHSSHPVRSSRCAWMPGVLPPVAGQPFPAIQLIRDNLQAVFKKHHIEIQTGPSPLASANGEELLIIAAHGGLTDSDQYFRTVVDEEGQVLLSAQALAKIFNGADVAILFVCSSGRIDSHPGANSTIGLVRELLNQGCRSVVAPPWALEAVVPQDWLPVFLERWDSGMDVLDSCFAANKAIAERTSFDLKRSIAMTVYGDPLVKKR